MQRAIANPATQMFSEADWAALDACRNATAERLATAPRLLPGGVRHRAFYRSAFADEGLKAYAHAVPPEDERDCPPRSAHGLLRAGMGNFQFQPKRGEPR